mgnify:CR=1 FL=1
MRRRAFTLVELLTVMAILAILYAIFMPIARAARAAAYQYNASNAIKQLGTITQIYAADNDDTAPLAFYPTPTGMQTWFGMEDGVGFFNPQLGILSPYTMGRVLRDPTHQAKDWLGDHSGFGYNWAQIGSDSHIWGTQSWYPWCANAARYSELSDPSETIFYATSAYVNVAWQQGGDGQTYDYGFIFEPYYWNGNPPVDFRHQGKKKVEATLRKVESDGVALVSMGDGRVKAMKQGQMTDALFMRYKPNTP